MIEPSGKVAEAATAAADRVDPSGKLHADVLALLHAPDRPVERYSEIVDIAALVVSTATFAWTVVVSLRAQKKKPEPEVLARRVRVEFPLADNISAEQRDLVIDVVVERILTGDEER
ncbi:hypothetical protein JNUCC0626_07815 [Lentzea sp. JNUCC 0626]|uniref:hypothetical protein n=1 Tax=Lentzea sp. JNUCC 0626 TaxID=3367513 RepID=UPI003747EC05